MPPPFNDNPSPTTSTYHPSATHKQPRKPPQDHSPPNQISHNEKYSISTPPHLSPHSKTPPIFHPTNHPTISIPASITPPKKTKMTKNIRTPPPKSRSSKYSSPHQHASDRRVLPLALIHCCLRSQMIVDDNDVHCSALVLCYASHIQSHPPPIISQLPLFLKPNPTSPPQTHSPLALPLIPPHPHSHSPPLHQYQ
ncbi:hypothetical protein BDR22DRAFT_635443 [Usnea florida]